MYFGHYDYDIGCDKKTNPHDVFAFWMRIRIMLKSSKMKKLERRRIF